MADGTINIPSGAGGLMRYNEEYESPFKVSPEVIVLFVVLIVVFVSMLKLFIPLTP